MGLGVWEIMAVLVIVLLVFGASRIPKLARGLGEGVSEFKKGLKQGQNEEESEEEQPEISSSADDDRAPPSDTG